MASLVVSDREGPELWVAVLVVGTLLAVGLVCWLWAQAPSSSVRGPAPQVFTWHAHPVEVSRSLPQRPAVPKVVPHRKPAVRPATTGYTRPVGVVKAYAYRLVGAGQFGCVDAIFTRESHWNPKARNRSSGAFGIAQMLHERSTDPFRQVRDGINYMDARYGSPCGAWAFWQGHGWY